MELKFLNLETAVGHKKDVQDIGVHGEIQKVVVTSVVMRHFCIVPGALRVRHEITGTIGRPRFVIGARRDEGA